MAKWLIVMWLLVGLVGCAADSTGGEGEPDAGPTLGGAVEGEPEPVPDAGPGPCDCRRIWPEPDVSACRVNAFQECVPCESLTEHADCFAK